MLIVTVQREVDDTVEEYQPRVSKGSDFKGELIKILLTMRDQERRVHIDAELVEKLDNWVGERKLRRLYGEVGRDVGDGR